MWTIRLLTRRGRLLRIGLMLAAAVFLVAGLLRGEAVRVLQRAVQVCLGCIGIG